VVKARLLILPALLAAGGAGPYLATEHDWSKPLEFTSAATSPGDAAALQDLAAASPVEAGGSAGPSAGGPFVDDFADVFRFNATPQWIAARWSRVTMIYSDPRFQGYRAPLLTGSGIDDLAGTITYYFDLNGVIQRLTFEGTTGDPRRLVQLMTGPYKFEQKPNVHGMLYLTQWSGQPISAMRILPATVIDSTAAHRRYNIQLEINRSGTELSDEFNKALQLDKVVRRW